MYLSTQANEKIKKDLKKNITQLMHLIIAYEVYFMMHSKYFKYSFFEAHKKHQNR